MTLRTNITSVVRAVSTVSCGRMLTPVMSFSGLVSVPISEHSNRPSGVPPFRCCHSRPAAHSVSNTP